MKYNKTFLILILLVSHLPVMSQTTTVDAPIEGRAGETILIEISNPIGNYAHTLLRSDNEFHVLGKLPYTELISDNYSIPIPTDAYGDYMLIVEILQFVDGFEPNGKSIGQIIRNLINIESFNQTIGILPYIIPSLGRDYHIVTWLGGNIHPMLGLAGINYTYVYHWDNNQRYTYYSNITGFGDLTKLFTDCVYSYYEL